MKYLPYRIETSHSMEELKLDSFPHIDKLSGSCAKILLTMRIAIQEGAGKDSSIFQPCFLDDFAIIFGVDQKLFQNFVSSERDTTHAIIDVWMVTAVNPDRR